MVQPPSQAGRFKPRKPPAKKIKPGAATGAAAASASEPPAAASAGSTSGRPSTGGRGRGRGRGRGGRSSGGGRGRGGRSGGGGGRGRKRTPVVLPRGAVYFTGDQTTPAATIAPTAGGTASSRTSSGGGGPPKVSASRKTKAKGKLIKMEKESDEVVVGELDVAIGSTIAGDDTAAKKLESKKEQDEFERQEAHVDPLAPKQMVSHVEYYDSDSSEEEEGQSRHKKMGGSSTIPPTQLPFPVAETRRAMYACQLGNAQEAPEIATVSEERHSDPPLVSPFMDNDNNEDDSSSWFLVQFPTRLPPLARSTAAAAAAVTSSSAGGPDIVTSGGGPAMSATAPDPVGSNAAFLAATGASATSSSTAEFDDSFKGACAGKLGKILVYKSGKTVLVMGGNENDGGKPTSPEIRMNVTEGLSCGFVQQAVAIDTNEGNFIPLGNVKKTLVVTPDVESAFSTSSS